MCTGTTHPAEYWEYGNGDTSHADYRTETGYNEFPTEYEDAA